MEKIEKKPVTLLSADVRTLKQSLEQAGKTISTENVYGCCSAAFVIVSHYSFLRQVL